MSISLSWNVCTNAALSQPISTHVERADNGGSFIEVSTPPVPYTSNGLTVRKYEDPTVVVGSSYSYRIRWQNAVGESEYSAVTPPLIVAIPLPAQPTGLVAVLS